MTEIPKADKQAVEQARFDLELKRQEKKSAEDRAKMFAEADRLEQERLYAEYMQKKAEREKKLEEEEQLMIQHAQQQAESERQAIDAKKAEFKQQLGWDKAKSEKAWDDILQDKMMGLGAYDDIGVKAYEELEREAREEVKKYRMPEARAESPDTEEEASGHDRNAEQIFSSEIDKKIRDSVKDNKQPKSGFMLLAYKWFQAQGASADLKSKMTTLQDELKIYGKVDKKGTVRFYNIDNDRSIAFDHLQPRIKQILQV